MIIFVLVLVVLFVLMQPTVTAIPLTAEEMLAYPDRERCAYVEIVRMDLLRQIDPNFPVPVLVDTVLCEGDQINLGSDTINR